MESPGDTLCSELCGPVSGLIYFSNMRISKGDMITVPVIYNPSTGHYTCLPKPMTKKGLENSFLGYDPIDKRFKVLFSCEGEHQILTLGTGKVSWRTIKMPLTNYPLDEGICINGILYYLAPKPVVIGCRPRANICFDVRSEKVWFLEGKAINEIFYYWPTKLINYKGKLGGVSTQWYCNYDGGYNIVLSLWILEDAKKQEWSTRNFYLRHGIECKVSVPLVVVGATATGEIIFSMNYTSKPFYVLYINPERNTFKRVEIGGFEAFEDCCKVYIFVDHVEDLKFITQECS